MTVVGQPIDRVDGRLKVCGAALYPTDFVPPRMTYAAIVQSTAPSGRIKVIFTRNAEASPGVIAVLSHVNAMKLPEGGAAAIKPPHGRALSLLQDDKVNYVGQPVAVVIADTLEHAMAAQHRIAIEYELDTPILDFATAKSQAYSPGKLQQDEADSHRGDLEAGIRDATLQTKATYTTPMEHHNPMEPHGTVAWWEGDRVTLYDSTQYVFGVKSTVAKALGISPENVRVVCPFVGGGFGSKGSAWSHVLLAVMAARQVGRPVKIVMERPQMFGPVGGRPRTEQTITLAADADHQLTAINHQSISNTSTLEDWTESCALVTRMLYACPNVNTSHRLVRLNVGSPTFQRAPGESTGMFALESAMDELAYAAGADPLEFRIKNHADSDGDKNLPFSSKSLRECYRMGAERFGWSKRNMKPGSLQDGRWLVGMGMASATRPAKRSEATAKVKLMADGTAVVQSSTEDLGTGTYTVMSQIAADALGLPVGRVRFELGDTNLPEAPISAGSLTVESVGSAVYAACLDARDQLIKTALADVASPLRGSKRNEIKIENGWLFHEHDKKRRESLAALITRAGGNPVEAQKSAKAGEETKKYSMHSFGAIFAEVRVDKDLHLVRVPRLVGAYSIGNVMNAKTAHSQMMGGIVWGLGMALYEESVLDLRYGRFVNANLAEYHIPVNADIGDIEIIFVPEKDAYVNPLGAKGGGEVSMTGVAGAVANAVFHATGKRIRDLPITLDKLA